MNEVVHSVNGIPIRLSSERWMHIVEHHDDLAGHLHAVLGTIRSPDAVYEGDGGELLAVSSQFTPYWLVVAYRETSSSDGFVITAFFTRRIGRVEGRRSVWKRESS